MHMVPPEYLINPAFMPCAQITDVPLLGSELWELRTVGKP
jgi:hypothetical protein